MPDSNNQQYLKAEQYKDACNLESRIQLHERFSTNPYGWFRWVFNQIVLPPLANILEIGCGPGRLWINNLDRIPPDWHITLSDFSPGMIQEAMKNIGTNQKAFTFEVFDAMGIPSRGGKYDAVIANHMLYHVPHLQRALAEIARVLTPDGRLYAATNGENHLVELQSLIKTITSSMNENSYLAFNADIFTLENGMEQLEPWFTQIELRRYEDALIITEAEPLVAYILSMIPSANFPKDTNPASRLTDSVNEMMNQQGSMHIHKSTGIFIGKK
jgi:ubiquinone/menaquinone biosynthesis C-methylase UbiE